ncbi:Aste57867_14427 [Aphanomyces stellatus]|uniref:Aste57867_14427 protein n=1 Tax=Aphanomyces stellatus TaxID=120398 RepID=A0A485L171_9STRA|nr:hypothetical protein As57867_014373 [Aphanomyces stellatus]VFT91249.1 Aste57867_14427 [Aphanomyces stellatus]
MAPHTYLGKIAILLSNMTRWDATLPPSNRPIFIRFARFTALPTIVTTNVPDYFYVLNIDSCPLASLTRSAFDQMPYLERLFLVIISFATFPDAIIAALPLLYDLNLRDNNLATVPMTWQTQTTAGKYLRSVWFDGNQLQDGPWAMVRQGVLVDLSSNPIASVAQSAHDIPTAIANGQVVLDDTPYCHASPDIAGCRHSLCASGCYTYMRRDHFCGPACFNSACAYDGGDCDDMDFDRP